MSSPEGIYYNLNRRGVGYCFDNKLTSFTNIYYTNSSISWFVKRRHLSTTPVLKEHKLFIPKGMILWSQK